MLSFGIMTMRMQGEKTYFYEIAKRAKHFGMECFKFIPSQFNPVSQKVQGERFNSQTDKWETAEFLLPAILYDRCFYGEDTHSSQCKAIVKWLRTREDLLFLGYGLPNKLDLYDALKSSRLSPYLLPSKPITSGKGLIQHLNEDSPAVIKPLNGSQGRGIYYLEKTGKEVFVSTQKQGHLIEKTFPHYDKAITWVNQLIKDKNYLVQPYKNLKNKKKKPFDIRVLLQKNENGCWEEIAKGIRVGKKNGIISNVNAGGTITSFEEGMNGLPASEKEYIESELQDILTSLPVILEKEFPPLFEIGVDIGICKDQAIWILDINSKPGRKVALSINPELSEKLYSAPLLYGKTLAKERGFLNEKALSSRNSS